MSQYRVTGPFPYCGHEPGSTFEAKADAAIKRAVERGSITPEKQTTAPAKSGASEAPSVPKTPSTPAEPEKE